MFGAGEPEVILLWFRDGEREDGREACVDGSRARRRNGEGEGGEDRSEKLHGSMGDNEWSVDERRRVAILFLEERGVVKRNAMRRRNWDGERPRWGLGSMGVSLFMGEDDCSGRGLPCRWKGRGGGGG